MTQGTSLIVNTVIQFISCCCLAGEYGYIKKCVSPYVWLLFAPGFMLSVRRRWQFSQYLKRIYGKKKKLLFLIESMMVGGAERVLISLVN